MTPLKHTNMNEKIKEIAEFDGWTFRNNGDTAELFRNGEFVMGCHGWKETPDFPIHHYLTDLNALHRVALDVMDRVDSAAMRHDIMSAFRSRPINGQYTDLVDAVYDAIVYLKKHNQCQPK